MLKKKKEKMKKEKIGDKIIMITFKRTLLQNQILKNKRKLTQE